MPKSWIRHVAGATTLRVLLSGMLVVALLGSQASFAAAPLMLSITPVTITIPASHRSATMSLTNPNDQTVNVQISTFQWTQDQDGNDTLSPTNDLIVYPLIFTIKPHAQRIVRIGSLTGVPAERTYRLILQTLSSVQPQESADTAGVRILTKASIPVFLKTQKSGTPNMTVALQVQRGHLHLRTSNNGTVHIPPQEIDIHGFAAGSTTPMLTGTARGWYLLPAITRTKDIPLPPDKCQALARIEVALRYDHQTTTQQLTLPPDACATT